MASPDDITTTASPVKTLESIALAYAARGLHIFPTHSIAQGVCSCGKDCGKDRGKHPRIRGWEGQASTDPATIREWWRQWPAANIAVALGPSNLFVIDVDPRNGGADSFFALSERLGEYTTLRSLTGGGGHHDFFRSPTEYIESMRLTAHAYGETEFPGVDTKGPGGYVILPPSSHASGRFYAWEVDGQGPIAELPLAWIEPLRLQPKPKALPVSGERIPDGSRRQTMLRLAGKFRRDGLSPEAVRDVLRSINRHQCDPPMDEAKLDALAIDVANRYAPAHRLVNTDTSILPPPPSSDDPDPAAKIKIDEPTLEALNALLEHRSDLGNAEWLIFRYGSRYLRYNHTASKWLIWDKTRWKVDAAGQAMAITKRAIRDLYTFSGTMTEGARKILAKHAIDSESKRGLSNALELSASDQRIASAQNDLDRDDWLLNVANGTIDLRKGQLRAHSRDDLITKIAPIYADARATCPLWISFLSRILNNDAELISFVQRAVGYSLTAQVSEHCLFMLYGTGRNGKSVFLEVIRALLGDYSQQAEFDTFLAKDSDRISNDIARLVGARFVAASEADEGRRFAESKIKHLTGGDTIAARFLYGEFFDFVPTHKIWLAANHKPTVRGNDEGVWSRIHLIPFTVFIPPEERDRHLLDKLRAELPGILNWALLGCLEWQSTGLKVPGSVVDATTSYRGEMDVFGEWLDERVTIHPASSAAPTALYASYKTWAEERGEFVLPQMRFKQQLKSRGFEQTRTMSARRWIGIGLAADPDVGISHSSDRNGSSSWSHDR